jgi:hypothetical protein
MSAAFAICEDVTVLHCTEDKKSAICFERICAILIYIIFLGPLTLLPMELYALLPITELYIKINYEKSIVFDILCDSF